MESNLEKYKDEIKERFLKPLEENTLLTTRCHPEKNRERLDGEYQRDYTRILYSSSFRRLQGKMQLFAVQSDQFIRNRLTHSLEVAQIARSIATEIGYRENDIYVVEACALAHDIGNPPFGHAGERFLNTLGKSFGGFEGNAQTFRILTTVEQKRAEFQGLNLTYRTLLGILKYYNKYSGKLSDIAFAKQKFIYDRDYDLVKGIIEETNIQLRTLDVQIVDLADEIAYAAHDLEDGLRLGILTPDEVMHDFCRSETDSNSQKELESIFLDSKQRAGFKNTDISSAEYTKLYRKEITSRVIHTLINDIGIVTLSPEEKEKKGTNSDVEIGFVKFGKLASGLKKTIYECITNNDEVYAYENEGNRMLQELYDFYKDHACYLPPEYRADNIIKQYPNDYREEARDTGVKDVLQNRLIMDYISGMMDEYVKTVYVRLIKNDNKENTK